MSRAAPVRWLQSESVDLIDLIELPEGIWSELRDRDPHAYGGAVRWCVWRSMAQYARAVRVSGGMCAQCCQYTNGTPHISTGYDLPWCVLYVPAISGDGG